MDLKSKFLGIKKNRLKIFKRKDNYKKKLSIAWKGGEATSGISLEIKTYHLLVMSYSSLQEKTKIIIQKKISNSKYYFDKLRKQLKNVSVSENDFIVFCFSRLKNLRLKTYQAFSWIFYESFRELNHHLEFSSFGLDLILKNVRKDERGKELLKKIAFGPEKNYKEEFDESKYESFNINNL